ncbi:uncharacterized protein LOC106649020 isoform X2 [Trichogramma pretiosum]|uniref:uncharacterized protein LOC106649020 isoform X2 n=1 Tax=Trichogramma pretiosum TaxID=7493 RepID=UPI000C71B340|nr:uncharacterized protein LOC106649020 isoform X2 [Trichogramma pretiosum]
MNPENEEQKPVPQTLCGALQKEANCKCLVLSVLIYGCLAAVTWCRCANVTKIVFNFTTFPIKSTKHVSPCEDGYIYIPVAFMGMLYLVYLVECYHSPIRIDLLHAESQSGVLARLTQLRLAQPTIWWKAISYHYVRRKRQVMRYRNGDNFTTTQVYYERVNSHAATSFYFYDYCGSKDISKELLLDPKIPITKITLSKGFAFSNVRSATEFEEARSRFFAEQFRDDYMEMREGLDLGVNFSPVTLVSVLGNPWFTRSYVYWCLSALLLSWPLRIIIECNTQYVNYQVTKLFGVNYDTPTNIQIHTSASQLSAPGSYMLAPSYSEALLMEPAAPPPQAATAAAAAATAATVEQQQAAATASNQVPSDMVPSYSEALLYQPVVDIAKTIAATGCECPCHSLGAATSTVSCASNESLQIPTSSRDESSDLPGDSRAGSSSQQQQSAESNARICNDCLGARPQRTATTDHKRRRIGRDYSEPDLRRSAELLLLAELVNNATRCSGRSLENIVENVAEESSLEASGSDGPAIVPINPPGESTGAIPKQRPRLQANPLANERPLPSSASSSAYLCLRSILKQNRRKFNRETLEELQSLTRSAADDDNGNDDDEDSCDCTGCRSDASAIERPDSLMINNIQRLPSCQFSVRRENSRTLIFASPIQVVCPTDPFGGRNLVQSDQPPNYEEALNLPVLSNARRSLGAAESAEQQSSSSSSSSSSSVPISVVVTSSGPRYTSVSVASTSSQSTGPKAPSANRSWNQSRATNTEQGPIIVKDDTRVAVIRSTSTQRSAVRNAETTAISLPTSIDGLTMPPDSRASSSTITTASQTNGGNVEVATAATSTSKGAAAGAPSSTSHGPSDPTKGKTKTRLTRSLTERRPSGNSTHDQSRRRNPALRNSFTERIDTGTRVPGIKRMNINIETSL